jgi:alpha/beta superfamily hydrolase
MQTQPIQIQGPAGFIEAIVEAPTDATHKAIGIVCHPHPLYRGTMNNKVVTTTVKAFQLASITAIRFNFRGVGQSEGQYNHAKGEQDDLRAVIKWVEQHYPGYKLVLAGFSFGSFIATKVASEIHPAALITIAPPVHHNDFANLPRIDFPWLVIQGEADEVVPVADVFDWLNTLNPQPTIIKMPNVSHFFHGQLLPLRDHIVNFLNQINW